jgi:DNA-binding PadR family transcriptional regulator
MDAAGEVIHRWVHSRTQRSGACVEFAVMPSVDGIRDSKQPDGSTAGQLPGLGRIPPGRQAQGRVLTEEPPRVSAGCGGSCQHHTEYAYLVFMSIKHGLLALLERGPMYGYQLRAAFEQTTGGTWPLNIGQVYTTLSRLERDDLVHALPEADSGQRSYEITDAGHAELARWFATPVSRADRPRDELAIKLALALTTPGVDVGRVVQTQRGATMRTLQEYTRLKAQTREPDLAWRLVLDAMLFQAEAEVRWLDHCEASLVRYSPPPMTAIRVGDPAEEEVAQ